jgi:phosphonate transport system substrate-binding protein
MKNLLFYLSSLIVVCTACNSSSGTKGTPDKLIIGIYSGDNPSQTKDKIGLFKSYLEKELNRKVEFYFTTDYTSLVEGIQQKKLDVVQLSPFSYVLATTKPCLIPLVTIGLNHIPIHYHSIIFTSSKSSIHNWDNLKKNAKNLTLCFGDPASTSGHLVPRFYMKSQGLDPDTSFKQTLFTGSHAASIMSVSSGKVDIGCSSNDLALDILVEQGLLKADEIRILWISEGIVNDAICVRNDLDTALRNKIRQAYLDVDKKDINAFRGSIYRYYPNPVNMQFIPTGDSCYDGIRKIAADVKELKIGK